MRTNWIITIAGVVLLAGISYAQTRVLFPNDLVQNMQRPCSYSGAPTGSSGKWGPVAVTGASAATGPFKRGSVRMVCNTAVHFRTSTTSPTAVTGDPLLPASTLEWFASEADYAAVIWDSTPGFCWFLECR